MRWSKLSTNPYYSQQRLSSVFNSYDDGANVYNYTRYVSADKFEELPINPKKSFQTSCAICGKRIRVRPIEYPYYLRYKGKIAWICSACNELKHIKVDTGDGVRSHMERSVHAVQGDKKEFWLYFSISEPISEESEPRHGRVGYCSFDKRVYSITFDGMIKGIAVYSRPLKEDECIKNGLLWDGIKHKRSPVNDQLSFVTNLIDGEIDWCEKEKESAK